MGDGKENFSCVTDVVTENCKGTRHGEKFAESEKNRGFGIIFGV